MEIVADRTQSLGDLHLFTATELSLTLGIWRTMFFRFSPKRAKRVDRGYGKIPGFSPEALPKILLAKLDTFRAAKRPVATVEKIVRQTRKSCASRKPCPLSTGARAALESDDAAARDGALLPGG